MIVTPGGELVAEKLRCRNSVDTLDVKDKVVCSHFSENLQGVTCEKRRNHSSILIPDVMRSIHKSCYTLSYLH